MHGEALPKQGTFARSLHLNSSREWKRYCQSGKKPNDIPNTPNCVYTKTMERMGRLAWQSQLGNKR